MSEPNKNLYQRGGIWWLEVKISGRKIRESLETDDAAIARKRRDKRIADLRASGGVKLGWDEVVAEWAAWFSGKKTKSHKTSRRYLVSLMQVHPYLTSYDVDKIDGKAILNLINARKRIGITDATIRRDLTAVSAVLKYAEDQNWREGNPAISKRRMLEESNEAIALPTDRDINDVLASCSPRFAAMVMAARHTGCRQDELVTVRWENFNEQRRTLTVIGKRGKRRTIDLNQPAFDLIKSHPHVINSPLIFCKEDGGSFMQAASDFTHCRRAAMAKTKRTITFRFHDLRHLYAVEALHGGMSIYKLQKQLGHSTIKMTERYLEFISPEEQEEAKRGSVMETPGVSGAQGSHI